MAPIITALFLATVLPLSFVSAQRPTAVLDSLFQRREERIAMRDGVRLFTVSLTPRRQDGPLPILMSRTPYGTASWGGRHRIEVGFRRLMVDGYIFVFQDIRKRHQSEGEFIMNRPPRDRGTQASADEGTDTWLGIS